MSPTCPSLQSLVNALFHLAAWIAPGNYAPGAVVSVPATGYFFAWVRRQARDTAAELIPAVAVGTVVAAVAIGFLSCLTAAPVSVRTALKPRGTSPTRQSHRTPWSWGQGGLEPVIGVGRALQRGEPILADRRRHAQGEALAGAALMAHPVWETVLPCHLGSSSARPATFVGPSG